MNTRTWRRTARMFGLGQTTAELASVRRRWKALLGAAAGFMPDQPTPRPRGRRTSTPGVRTPLREVRAFGPNPGGLRMVAAVPPKLARGAPLVVVLHGCGQSAAGYDRGAGWSALGAEAGFAVLYPEQQKRNNAHRCFSWFQRTDVTRDEGEVASIRDMIEHMVASHGLDSRRVYITGLSAGAAMANAMLATYPELFAAGALVAGLPYGAATGLAEAFQAMTSGRTGEPETWADHVRSAAPAPDAWPCVSIWHGTADTTVAPVNAGETVKQWLGVHGIAETAPAKSKDGRLRRRSWRRTGSGAQGSRAQGDQVLVEEVLIEGMGHGTPVDGTIEGEDGRFFLDVGVASTRSIAAHWGLVQA
jgi:poly(hydroxyalkanoate) depolymerase family esterase